MNKIGFAIRNTLILLLVLILLAGSGWAYITYFQKPEIEKLATKLEVQKNEMVQKEKIAARFNVILKTYNEASRYFKNYDKALYQSSNEDKVFDFLTTVNQGYAFNDFNFAFVDSTVFTTYGVMNMKITGTGHYRNIVNFVRALELSEPLNKIRNLNIKPVKQDSSYNNVEYSFDLTSYYDRTRIIEPRSLNAGYNAFASVNNPFYPLIHDIKPNTSNKVNIGQSKLIALSSGSVFLIDQNGKMRHLQLGDKVYLGYLSDINIQARTATFTLDKGGIIERVTIGNEPKKEG